MVLVPLDLNKTVLFFFFNEERRVKEESGGLKLKGSERPLTQRAAKGEGFFSLSILKMNIERKTRSWEETRQERMRCLCRKKTWIFLALEER